MTEARAEQGQEYLVDAERCFRCGACSSVAPELFAMSERGAIVVRQPETTAEGVSAEAARLGCPGLAIGIRGKGDVAPLGSSRRAADGPLYTSLFDEAERVRWRMSDIPWDAIERERVSPAFVRFVREMAVSELTTFSATRRFLTEMADDPDFTSWVAIWFYEETKHPDALLRWLAAFGVTIDVRTVMRGRVSAPFMRSRTGTLVMNILSELFASAGYQDLARSSKEPVLARITRLLAGDEARHGASFFRFAERAISLSKTPDLERLQALKVLYYWVQAADHVEHPVSQFHEKIKADPELSGVLREIGADHSPVLSRACRLVGALVGRRLDGPDDVLPALREMSREGH